MERKKEEEEEPLASITNAIQTIKVSVLLTGKSKVL